MTTDQDLLRQYTEEGSEVAFAEVVRRHVDFVHSTAMRVVATDTHLAEDVTQRVFSDLARKARPLSSYQSLAAWLHRTTRYTAISAIRAEQRRRTREHEATLMQEITTSPPDAWAQLRPLLDEAVDELKPADREAVLLRFFHGKSHREVGDAMGLSENSANKRIERALEKLRDYFTRRGVTTTSAILGAAISANSVQAAPVDLAGNVTQTALASATTAGTAGGAIFLTLLYMSTKTKVALGLVFLALIASTVALHWPTPASTETNSGRSATFATVKLAAAPTAASVLPAQVEAPKAAATAASTSVANSTPSPATAVPAATLTPTQINAMFAKLTQGFVQIYTSLIGSRDPVETLKQIQEIEPQIQVFAAGVKGTPLEQPLAVAVDALTSTKEALLRGDLVAAKGYLEKANQQGVLLQGSVQRLVEGVPRPEVAPAQAPDPAELAALFVQVRQLLTDIIVAVQNNDAPLALQNIATLEPVMQLYAQKIENTPGHDDIILALPILASLKTTLQKGNLVEAKHIVSTFLSIQDKQVNVAWPL